MICKYLQYILNLKLTLHVFTVSKDLFDSKTKFKQTTKIGLIIDISAARKTYRSFYITQFGLLCTSHNLEDGLSKVTDNGALRMLFTEGFDKFPVEQWILQK